MQKKEEEICFKMNGSLNKGTINVDYTTQFMSLYVVDFLLFFKKQNFIKHSYLFCNALVDQMINQTVWLSSIPKPHWEHEVHFNYHDSGGHIHLNLTTHRPGNRQMMPLP